MQNRKPPHATRICDEGLALDEPAPSAAMAASAAPFRNEDWAARQRVRTVVRELRRPNPATANSLPRIPSQRQFDVPHDLFDQLEHATTPGIASSAPPLFASSTSQQPIYTGSQVVAWLTVVAGMLTLAGGLSLIGWSLTTHKMEYWNLALALSLGGQGTLIFGLVLVISRLWRSSRHAAAKLQEVHARLGELQQTSESLVATRSGGAPAFYADLVRSASPHVLLANLKGQVDQLATRVGSAW